MPASRKKLSSDSYRSNAAPIDAKSSNVDSAESRASRPATRQVPEFPPSTTAGREHPHAQTINETLTRRGVDTISNGRAGHGDRRFSATNDKMGASGLVAPEIQYHTPHHQPPHTTALLRPPQPHAQNSQLSPRSHRQPPPVVTPVPIPRTPSLSNQPPAERPLQPPQSADRNIDKVVLGDLCFRTWYPSYYGKEILDLHNNHSGKAGGGKEESGRKDQHPVLGMLYVCPHCFKYSKELVAWGGHVRVCSRKDTIPGHKVYVHPRGTRKVQVAQPQSAGGSGKRKRDSGLKYFEETVTDQGEWSIWEVDGEDERLFCQNLSLFAKLFLDNKSVFFDVTGFNYFLLVYTPPASQSSATPRPQIVGFFSKEKMSWDNNNLACILIFPPWQRKGLGSLLMGASYEISRREQVLGGPEKPISELGRKGYRRFWMSEISRWLLSLEEGTVVDVNDCSEATYISWEDVVVTLREMELLADAGKGPPKPAKTTNGHGPDEGEEEVQQTEVKRVKVDKDAVRKFVSAQRLNLERTYDAEGFVEGYAVKESDGEDEDMSDD